MSSQGPDTTRSRGCGRGPSGRWRSGREGRWYNQGRGSLNKTTPVYGKFKGNCVELSGHVFDCSDPRQTRLPRLKSKVSKLKSNSVRKPTKENQLASYFTSDRSRLAFGLSIRTLINTYFISDSRFNFCLSRVIPNGIPRSAYWYRTAYAPVREAGKNTKKLKFLKQSFSLCWKRKQSFSLGWKLKQSFSLWLKDETISLVAERWGLSSSKNDSSD